MRSVGSSILKSSAGRKPNIPAKITLGKTSRAVLYDITLSFAAFQRARGKVPKNARISASGRAQVIAFTLGKGRVVVAGEAAMFTAQLAGPGGEYKMGMNEPGIDNRQFATNVLRWLAKKL